jgi:ribose transport system substrate-binding protein
MIRHRKLTAALVVGALAVAACGGDDDDTPAAEEPATEEPAEEPAAEEPAEEPAAEEPAEEPAAEEPAEEPAAEEPAEEPAAEEPAEEDAGLAAAQANVDQYRDPNQPIGVTIPLDGPAPTDVTFAWLECEIPSCQYITAGVEAATDALGWELLVIGSESANPAPYFQQAIDAGADYIASSGEAPQLYEAEAAAAADAGIKILSCFDTTVPDPENSNIWTQCGDTTFVEKTGPLMADWAIVDSEGTANVLIASIPDFPVLVAETDAYKAQMDANCPGCTYSEVDFTITDLVEGAVPSAIASQLQANEDIDYVFFSFSSLPAGVTAALSEVGLLDRVTVYGQDFEDFNLQEIVAGTMGAWSADPKAYAGWLMVDAAARLELGMELTEERAAASLPTYIVETPEQAQAILDGEFGYAEWVPPTMEEDFKALWGVG